MKLETIADLAPDSWSRSKVLKSQKRRSEGTDKLTIKPMQTPGEAAFKVL
jgi:hypothetical protein